MEGRPILPTPRPPTDAERRVLKYLGSLARPAWSSQRQITAGTRLTQATVARVCNDLTGMCVLAKEKRLNENSRWEAWYSYLLIPMGWSWDYINSVEPIPESPLTAVSISEVSTVQPFIPKAVKARENPLTRMLSKNKTINIKISLII